ncbi:MAG: peptidylprolyl isomerase [Candidatus Marinimicrobia bacterium]|nr:peptidylprolyl isomerase [Candidatus Neomarinimicrobiota bacterium]MBL7010476.1 peptidylprolyl isomerase [Candidatus Neomarinimicrobiota bacterium]MBL7030965.1 peptidylprolyl isomerase [Candidatus Neomarinimicrobiota bacterium]
MMTTLRNRMHVVLWALLALFVLSMTVGGLVGGANIIDQLLGRVSPSEAIGAVNGDLITPDQFNQAVNARLEAVRNSGSQVTDPQMDAIREEVWNAFIEERLTEQAIVDLGISVADDEIIYQLENNPPIEIQRLFFANNEFDRDTYNQALNTPGMIDWAPIESWMRHFYIPRFKLQQFINMSAIVSQEDVRDEFIKRNTDFTISALHITNNAVEDLVEAPSDEAMLADYQSRLDDFRQDEKRHLTFVSWAKAPTKEDTIRVMEEAEFIIADARNGQNFATLANIHTQDPGNQVSPDSGRGGDLGWFGKGQMVAPFETAAFSAEKGDVVGPVLSPFGYHIIKIDSIRTQSKEKQVKARHVLLKVEMGQNSRSDYRRKATLFSYDAQDYGFSAALDSHNVQSQSANSIGEKDIFLGTLGPFRSAVRWAFNADEGATSDPIESNEFYAVFSLDSITPAGVAPFEDSKIQVRAALTREKEDEATENLAMELKSLVDSGSTFESIKKDNDKIDIVPSDTKKLSTSFISLGRSDQIAGALLNADTGDLIGPIKTFRGYGIIQVLNIGAFDSAAWNIQKDLVRLELVRQKQNRVYQSWMTEMKNDADVVDNRKYYF